MKHDIDAHQRRNENSSKCSDLMEYLILLFTWVYFPITTCKSDPATILKNHMNSPHVRGRMSMSHQCEFYGSRPLRDGR